MIGTLAMVYYSYKSIKERNDSKIEENEANIIIYPNWSYRELTLIIANYGNTFAKNFTINVDKNFYDIIEEKINFLDDNLIEEIPPKFKYEIILYPKMELEDYIFNIHYEYDTIYNTHYSLNKTIDLNYAREIIRSMNINESVKDVMFVGNKLNKINDNLKKNTDSIKKKEVILRYDNENNLFKK